MRRNFHVIFKTACLVLVALFIFAGYIHSKNRSFFSGDSFSCLHFPADEILHDTKAPLKDGNATLLNLGPSYINAIMNPKIKPSLDLIVPLRLAIVMSTFAAQLHIQVDLGDN